MKAHCENGAKIANWLKANPKVGKVYWPGFEDHPGHAVAKKQMKAFGGMISFELKNDSVAEAKEFCHLRIYFHWPKAWAVWKA
jgi:cystathionine beta-lyase/cystathionine gamma-synthase